MPDPVLLMLTHPVVVPSQAQVYNALACEDEDVSTSTNPLLALLDHSIQLVRLQYVQFALQTLMSLTSFS